MIVVGIEGSIGSTCPKSGGVGSIINPLIPGCPPSLCFQPILEPMGAHGDKRARDPTHQQEVINVD